MKPNKISINLVLISFLFLFFGTSKIFANSAQPGVWNAGGKVFTMMYPEDSATFKKVQMQQEKIYIQLYKGYAVVKGWYKFKNTTSEKLNFKMGYPLNGIYSGGEVYLNQIEMDSLGSFKIFAEQKPLEIIKEPNSEYGDGFGNINTFSENWYVWQMDFEPNQTKEVEVYFIVETNKAGISKGYNSDRYNAFIYLLESGSVWKNPIERGDFYVQLMDGLTEKDVHGFSDAFDMKYAESQNLFWGNKINLSPTIKDNLVFTYFQKMENFSFANILLQSESLYKKIDELSQTDFGSLSFSDIEARDPYQVKATAEGYLPFILTMAVILLPAIIVVIIAIIIIALIVRYVRKKQKKNNP